MSGFGPITTTQGGSPDPTKHVQYSLGMVLGVDDFTQEFAYLAERDRWLARDVLGYGTLWGLEVTTRNVVQDPPRGPEVLVSPGVALSPRGQMVRIAATQCANLNDWLAANAVATWGARNPYPTDSVKLYVVLSYRESPTDNVPVPGAPCRSEDEAMAPSRTADDFKLELRLSPPNQFGEGSVQDLVKWLRNHIEVSDAPGSSVSVQSLTDALSAAGGLTGSPPAASPPGDYLEDGSPPSRYIVYAGDLCSYLHAAFRLWVTSLRPRWRTDWLAAQQIGAQPPDEDAVLLATLHVPLTGAEGSPPSGNPEVDENPPVPQQAPLGVDDEDRPYLLHLRLLQEWLLCHGRVTSAARSYGPIAAAQVGIDGLTMGPAYNGLHVESVDSSDPSRILITVSFTGYQNPAGTPTRKYIVKALFQPGAPGAGQEFTTVTLEEFTNDGVVLRLANPAMPGSPPLSLTGSSIMVEVSQYVLG